jgi:hypothetical protein
MEALTRLVADSLARHGFDRPVDPRRLQWSRWFRCDSPHSLLVVPSKPGIFAIAEEIADLGSRATRVETAAPGSPERSSALLPLGGAALQRCDSPPQQDAASAPELKPSKRMLAVLQFSEDDDMAYTLDRMFTRINPMRSHLASGKCFLRFVIIEDQAQRRSICTALNQWMLSSAEKASGIPAAFSSSLEVNTAEERPTAVTDRVGWTLLSDSVGSSKSSAQKADVTHTLPLDSGANKNLHCPHPLPSGF